jgi:hypothetical protein
MHAENRKKRGKRMKISKKKMLAATVVLVTFVSMFAMLPLPVMTAYVDVDDYAYLEGVLDTDSYALYPYNACSLDVGFSKYGEMVNPDEPVGLRYGDIVDPFSNENVSVTEWNEGWVMNISYDYEGDLHNVWAYALFSDFRAIEGDWITGAEGPLDDRSGYRGGRKTNGYAETMDMKVLYDGPRRCITLLETRIYDPLIPNPTDPDDPKGLPLVVLYIQIVFNKVKKYIVMIKDIKLTTESKLLEKVQVKFGQRGEWDLGWEPEDWMPRSYAHFYHALPTKYFKHPWYYTDVPGDPWLTGYDVCQIIDQSEEFVAYAAYWPELMSWRVESIAALDREDKLTDLSDWEHFWDGEEGTETEGWEYHASIPGYYQYELYYPDCEFPPYWTDATPEVYVDGVKQTEYVDYDYYYSFGSPGGSRRMDPGSCDDEVAGDFWLYLYGYPGDEAEVYVHWKLHAEQDDMTCEPRTPYTMGEWIFDLSYDDEDLPTHQFRCVTVYGVTHLNDGEDWDIGTDYDNILDSEVLYQLDEVFNPWDLRQAVGQYSWGDYGAIYDYDWGEGKVNDLWPGKWTERWVEFYTGDGEEEEFWLPQQIVVPDEYLFPCWEQYCSAREKVLVDGELQTPGEDEDYELMFTHDVNELLAEGPMDIDAGDIFNLMYPRLVMGSVTVELLIDDVTYTLVEGTTQDYSIDYADGKLYMWHDEELEEDDELNIYYSLHFPAAYIDFYEESVPEEDAHIKILYSTFRIVYKVDKFFVGIDGMWIEDGDSDYFMGPLDYLGEGDYPLYLRYGPIVPPEAAIFTEDAYFNWVNVMIGDNVTGMPYLVDPMYWDWYPEDAMYTGIETVWINWQQLELSPGDVIELRIQSSLEDTSGLQLAQSQLQ